MTSFHGSTPLRANATSRPEKGSHGSILRVTPLFWDDPRSGSSEQSFVIESGVGVGANVGVGTGVTVGVGSGVAVG